MTQLSIVATMYRSAPYVKEFYDRTRKVLESLGIDDYEFVLVNDGSPDHSLEEAITLHKQDSKVKVIELSRNFGHHKAIMTGLSHATGEHIFLIDMDLEEPPELLEEFWQEMQKSDNENLDVVYGVQKTRKGGWLERWSGDLFYKIFNVMADSAKIPKNFLTVRLMKQNYVRELEKFKGNNFIFAPVCKLAGFNQKEIEVVKKSSSKTSYSFFRRYNLLVQAILSYSTAPLYFIFYFGMLIAFLAFIFGASIVFSKIFLGTSVDGWASIMVSIWFIGGAMISFMGVVAIYISKIFIETRGHPFSVIRKIWE